MIKVFKNIYQAENFVEKLNKKCCKGVSNYLVKCEGCQEIFCFPHVKTVEDKEGRRKLVCFLCSLEYKIII
jgi:hypothetical protein